MSREPVEREAMRKAKRWLDRARRQADEWLGNVTGHTVGSVVMVKHLRSVMLAVGHALDVERNPKLRRKKPISKEVL